MHSIKQLADIVGLNENQIRTRLNLLRPWFDQFIRRGEKNKILVNDSGLEVFRRFQQLERESDSLQIVASKIKQEQNGQHNSVLVERNDLNQTNSSKALLKEKERQIKRLEKENQYLRDQLERKEDQIQRLVPAPRQEKPSASPWELLRNWLFQRSE